MSTVLILGGCGFIGRNMVEHLIKNERAAFIRVVDKMQPAMAFLGPFEPFYSNPITEFIQANLSSDGERSLTPFIPLAGVTKAFALPEGKKWDLVINCAGESKYGQSPAVYKERCTDLAIKCGTMAAKLEVGRFIELSTGQVYKEGKKPSDEKSALAPWTEMARSKLAAEEGLRQIKGLNLTVLRLAVAYGPGDVYGLTPRLVVAAVYRHTKGVMKLLWTKDLRINTVHVRDVAAAIWHIANTESAVGQTFNLADKNDSDQGKINALLEAVFGIKTEFAGVVLSNFAKLNLKSVTEDVNEEHMEPWSAMQKEAGITSHLSPYLDQELLYNNSLSIDGSAIESTGFKYEIPVPSPELIGEVVELYQKQKLFPPA